MAVFDPVIKLTCCNDADRQIGDANATQDIHYLVVAFIKLNKDVCIADNHGRWGQAFWRIDSNDVSRPSHMPANEKKSPFLACWFFWATPEADAVTVSTKSSDWRKFASALAFFLSLIRITICSIYHLYFTRRADAIIPIIHFPQVTSRVAKKIKMMSPLFFK